MLKTFQTLFILLLIAINPVSAQQSELNVAVMLTSEQEASGYRTVIDAFHKQNPGTKILIHYYYDARYKKSIKQWLTTKKFDLLYWQAGRVRLFNLAQEGLIEELNDLWHSKGIGDSLAGNLRPLVDFNGQIIAIPYSYYHWGFFYNKPLFEKLNLTIPTTYSGLLSRCKTLRKNNIIPIGMGLSEQWPVLAWYGYFAIRNYGIKYYRQMVDGEISWLDERNYNVMEHWSKLLSSCVTRSGIEKVNWQVPSRALIRAETGMVLNGNFINHLFDPAQQQQIGFFPFPQISEKIPRIESAPVEVWIMPKGGKQKQQAEQFVKFFMQAEYLNDFNHAISYLSPHRTGNPILTGTMQQGAELLKEAEGLIQYIDRDAKAEFVAVMENQLTDYISHRDIELVLLRLENARKRYYQEAQ